MIGICRRTHGDMGDKATSSSQYVMNTESKPMYKWNEIDWRKLERRVFKLQKRIYQASLSGNVRDTMEVDHVIPKSKGGKDTYENWQLLHRHCHDRKTTNDGSYGTKSDCNRVKPKPPAIPDNTSGETICW